MRELAPDVQSVWIACLRPIRLADQLAENQQLDPASRRFDRFIGGILSPNRGFVPEPLRPPTVQLPADAWAGYLSALREYSRNDLCLSSMDEHRRMLDRLSGSLFQLLPFLWPAHFEAIRGLGTLDQFFNNLRDLAEDSAHGICYFPNDVLDRFGLRRKDVLGGGWKSKSGWPKLMRFWLNEYLPELKLGAARFDACSDLHPSVARLRSECRARYRRILRRFRAANGDFYRFAKEYWRDVRKREV